jgi:hypothetical protein
VRNGCRSSKGRQSGLVLLFPKLAILTLAITLLPTIALAGKEPWPQYANIAPLPGGGIAINSAGEADGTGAMQINIPVAYTPGWGFINASAYLGDYCNAHDEPFGNGTGLLGMGFTVGSFNVYGSGMAVSRITSESKAVNGQIQLVKQTNSTPALAFGVQDALEKEPYQRAFYGVATRRFEHNGKPVYGTLGFGSGRFLNRVFGGVSMPISKRFNVGAEYDGFQFNIGVGWRPAGREGKLTLLGGYNGKAGWLAGMGTTIKFSSSRY